MFRISDDDLVLDSRARIYRGTDKTEITIPASRIRYGPVHHFFMSFLIGSIFIPLFIWNLFLRIEALLGFDFRTLRATIENELLGNRLIFEAILSIFVVYVLVFAAPSSFYMGCWRAWGREKILITTSSLTIEYSAAFLRRSRNYDLERISSLRSGLKRGLAERPKTYNDRWSHLATRANAVWNYTTLVFDYDSHRKRPRRVHFGRELSPYDQATVIHIIQSYLETDTQEAR